MAAPLRILMTADTLGGVWTYAMELAAALAGGDVEIALATMGALPTAAQRKEAARHPHLQLSSSGWKLEWMEEPWDDVDAAGEWLLELAERFRPDVVHLNGYAHGGLPWGAPVLMVAHSCVLSWWRAVKRESVPERLAEYGARVAEGLRAADLVVAPSRAMAAALGEEYALATPVRVIPNGRQPHLFPPGEKQAKIFSAGRLWDPAKNTALLETIAPDLSWPLYLAGRPATSRPEGLDRDSSPIFLGELSTEALAAHLAESAIYAAPARYEPFGLGILEAALAECALVLADIPSLREIWQGAALFVPPEDRGAWRAALEGLAEDEAERTQLAGRARSRALELGPQNLADAYRASYLELKATAGLASAETCLR